MGNNDNVVRVDSRHGGTHDRTKPKPKQLAVGHEVPLSSMIANQAKITIDLVSGREVIGTMKSFDKFSITIQPEDATYPRTYYKHAIESFTRLD